MTVMMVMVVMVEGEEDDDGVEGEEDDDDYFEFNSPVSCFRSRSKKVKIRPNWTQWSDGLGHLKHSLKLKY